MDKVHIYMCLFIASIKSIAGNKARPFLSLFLISNSSFPNSAEATTEENDLGDYVTVPCSPKMTQPSRTVDDFKF